MPQNGCLGFVIMHVNLPHPTPGAPPSHPLLSHAQLAPWLLNMRPGVLEQDPKPQNLCLSVRWSRLALRLLLTYEIVHSVCMTAWKFSFYWRRGRCLADEPPPYTPSSQLCTHSFAYVCVFVCSTWHTKIL